MYTFPVRNSLAMNTYKIFAVIFGLISLGSLNETFRVMTSVEPDIANNRASILPIAIILTFAFVYLTIRFWKKSKQLR